MSWSWSHTNEAYDNARKNLFALDLAILRAIHAEWVAYLPDSEDADSEGFSVGAHTAYHCDPPMPNATAADLAYEIWERASEFATCDNGGFNAWICPFGCHTVSFDLVEPVTTQSISDHDAPGHDWEACADCIAQAQDDEMLGADAEPFT